MFIISPTRRQTIRSCFISEIKKKGIENPETVDLRIFYPDLKKPAPGIHKQLIEGLISECAEKQPVFIDCFSHSHFISLKFTWGIANCYYNHCFLRFVDSKNSGVVLHKELPVSTVGINSMFSFRAAIGVHVQRQDGIFDPVYQI